MSRAPLREALNRLSREGLVTIIRNRGYHVTPLTIKCLQDLAELRRIIESESARLAAQRATRAEIEEIEKLAELPYVPGERTTYDAYLRNNTAFHAAVARSSHNARIQALVVSLLEQLQRQIYLVLDGRRPCFGGRDR
jgi:DNA-binding GntR family transcriptional regulator